MNSKILFFLPNLNGGGAERVTVNIINKLDLKKVEPIVVLIEKKGSFIEFLPPNIEIIDLNAKKSIFSVMKLRKLIYFLNPDIIYSTLFRTHIAVDLALMGIQNKPKLIFRSPGSPRRFLEKNKYNLLVKFFLDRAYRNADVIIAQTDEMKEDINIYHRIDLKKILVLINPIDINYINKNLQNIQNPFVTDHINVVAAGRLDRVKGFDLLIKSFKKVIEQNDNFRLYIIGEDNGERKSLIKLIKSLSLDRFVFLLGFQFNPYKYFYYSDLYILSSRSEGLPNTVLENLYLKKPIIATRCLRYIEKLIKDGRNGFLVDNEDYVGISNAILNYEKIDPGYETICFNNSIIEKIFDAESIDTKDK